MDTALRETFERLVENALAEAIRASGEHPDTKEAEVSRVDVEITVHYKGTTTTTICNPSFLAARDF